jgi:hypothetical protein
VNLFHRSISAQNFIQPLVRQVRERLALLVLMLAFEFPELDQQLQQIFGYPNIEELR